MAGNPERSISPEMQGALRSCRAHFGNAAAFSLAINLLYLAAPLYMLQVYDRVIASASALTLVMLTIALLVAFAALAGLDFVRARILARAGSRLDDRLGARVVTATFESSSRITPVNSQPLREFDTFRQFVAGGGINALFDAPWAPIYIAVIFLLHPLLGAFAIASALLLIAMALLNQWAVKSPLRDAADATAVNYAFTDMSLRNSQVVLALGMEAGLIRRWRRDRLRLTQHQLTSSDRAAAFASIIKFLRLAMQSLILGLGAYLVIERLTTAGAMFAASILLARALQPVEQIVAAWRNVVAAHGAFWRVNAVLRSFPPAEAPLALPRPLGHLAAEDLTYVTPGTSNPVLRHITFAIEPGEVLGIIGPSGAGKSTLSRHMVGVVKPTMGAIRLDGAEVSSWPREAFGEHVGYLPQDIELFADSIAVNISRFGLEKGHQPVIAAATLAGVHGMILRLPNGYETQVGDGGAVLSGGIRQRVGLARAVYGNPSLVVLDEPSSNLDADGDAAVLDCIAQLKARGTTVVIVSHRPNIIAVVDKILILKDGAVDSFGPRNEVLGRVARPIMQPPVSAAAG